MKISLLSWDRVCQPRDRRRLGIQWLKDCNTAFIMKLGWNIITKPKDFWVCITRAKYLRGWSSCKQRVEPKSGSHIWRAITSVWHNISRGVKHVVINGKANNLVRSMFARQTFDWGVQWPSWRGWAWCGIGLRFLDILIRILSLILLDSKLRKLQITMIRFTGINLARVSFQLNLPIPLSVGISGKRVMINGRLYGSSQCLNMSKLLFGWWCISLS